MTFNFIAALYYSQLILIPTVCSGQRNSMHEIHNLYRRFWSNSSFSFNYNIGLYRPIRYSNRLGFGMKTHPRQSQLGNKIPSGISDSEKLSLISSIVGKSLQIRNCLVLEFDNPRIVEKVIFSLCFVRDNIPYHGKLSRYFQLTKFCKIFSISNLNCCLLSQTDYRENDVYLSQSHMIIYTNVELSRDPHARNTEKCEILLNTSIFRAEAKPGYRPRFLF